MHEAKQANLSRCLTSAYAEHGLQEIFIHKILLRDY